MQFTPLMDVSDLFSIPRPNRILIRPRAAGQLRLAFRREVPAEDVGGATAVGKVKDVCVIRCPGDGAFVGDGVSDLRRAASILCGSAKISPWAMNAIFFPSGESARSRNPVVILRCVVAGPPEFPATGSPARGATGGEVEFPNAKLAFENDRFAIGGDGRPENAAIGEVRHLLRRGSGRHPPDVLGTGFLGHEEQFFTVGGPRRLQVLRVVIDKGVIGRRRVARPGRRHERNPRLIDMGVSPAPPLITGYTTADESDGVVGRIWQRLGLIGLAIRGNGCRGSTSRVNPVEIVHSPHIRPVGSEVEIFAVGRSRIQTGPGCRRK